MNPSTNFGKRFQISAALDLLEIPVRSQRAVATKESTKAQTPIHMSRPMTFMSVNAATAASGFPEIPETLPA